MDEKATPLLDVHKQLKARMAGFGGWLMPIQYEGIIAEHVWTRNSASLFDICNMGEFKIKGNPLKVNLDKILTFNLSQMPELSFRYGFMLNDSAGVIDDVVIYKIKTDEFMLVVNAGTTVGDEAHLQKNLSPDAGLKNISDDNGKTIGYWTNILSRICNHYNITRFLRKGHW